MKDNRKFIMISLTTSIVLYCIEANSGNVDLYERQIKFRAVGIYTQCRQKSREIFEQLNLGRIKT